jgi:UDP-N-acetylglucosamine 2-epimerase (non-hydrolysing)
MKIAPLYHAIKNEGTSLPKIIHSGQHYSYQMSQSFFDDFGLPAPHYHLGVGSGSHAEQTGKTMMAYEKLCLEESSPDLVIVVGDVNATAACCLAAKKINLRVAHLEAGLRSFDLTMPEEINRIVTDSISDYHWTPSEDADDNLKNEGIKQKQISLVGNIMIDTYCMMEKKIQQNDAYRALSLSPQGYVVLTLHRPVNVDSPKTLIKILDVIGKIDSPVIFTVHPRTRKNLEKIEKIPKNIRIIEPLGYIDFMNIVSNSKFVISDSGGIQEETTYLGISCFTLRESTERPITITVGSNQLVSIETLLEKTMLLKRGSIPKLWDGKTAQRILALNEFKEKFNYPEKSISAGVV